MPKISVTANQVHLGDKWAHGHPVLDGKLVTGIIYELGEIEIRLNEGENVLTFFPTDTVGVDRVDEAAEVQAKPARKQAPMTQAEYSRRRIRRYLDELWEKEKAGITQKSLNSMSQRERENLEDDFARRGENLDDFIVAKGWDKTKPEPAETGKHESFWKRLIS